MRKILVALLILVLVVIGLGVGWIVAGPKTSLLLDNYRTVETASQRIHSIRYEGTGSGGVLRTDAVMLSLNQVSPPPNIGLTKEGQLALAAGGKVFPFGPLPKTADDNPEILAASVPPEDDAQISLQHSILPWPTPLDFNFMTGASPSWKRYTYQRLTWTKPNGSRLEMLWRYEQHFIGQNGWTSATMTNDKDHTGLIKIEINP
jgi:hypothetical protein